MYWFKSAGIAQQTLHKNWSFPVRVSSIRFPLQEAADLVTLTEEIFNGKPRFLCSEMISTAKLPILKRSIVAKALALLLSKKIKAFTNFFENQSFLGINLWMCKISSIRRSSKKRCYLGKNIKILLLNILIKITFL